MYLSAEMSLDVQQKATSAMQTYLQSCTTHLLPSKRKVVALHVQDYRN